tara:strand:+ start:44 stop:313 length:270 start_codon:yes stop_codon:yes gene_type:complete
MSWENILKEDSLDKIIMDFINHVNDGFNYDYRLKEIKALPNIKSFLKKEMQFYMSDMYKHEEKGRIDEAQRDKMVAPIEKFMERLERLE